MEHQNYKMTKNQYIHYSNRTWIYELHKLWEMFGKMTKIKTERTRLKGFQSHRLRNWWKNDCRMTAWWHSDNCQTTASWLTHDCLMTAWRLTEGQSGHKLPTLFSMKDDFAQNWRQTKDRKKIEGLWGCLHGLRFTHLSSFQN